MLTDAERAAGAQAQEIRMSCMNAVDLLGYFAGTLGVPTTRLVDGMSVDESFLKNTANWLDNNDTFLLYRNCQRAVPRFSHKDWYRVGRALQATKASGYFNIILMMMSTDTVYRRVPTMVAHSSKVGEYRLVESERGHIRLRYSIPNHPVKVDYTIGSECWYHLGVLSAMPKLQGASRLFAATNHEICSMPLGHILQNCYAVQPSEFSYTDEGVALGGHLLARWIRLRAIGDAIDTFCSDYDEAGRLQETTAGSARTSVHRRRAHRGTGSVTDGSKGMFLIHQDRQHPVVRTVSVQRRKFICADCDDFLHSVRQVGGFPLRNHGWPKMQQTRWLSLVLLLLSQGPNSALTLTISYLQGNADVRSGYPWSQLSIGESIARDPMLKLDANSYIELTGAGATITLDQPGTCQVKNLVSQSKAMGLAGVAQAFVSTFTNLLQPRSANQSTVAGVRAANKGAQRQSAWFSSEAGVYLQAGKTYLEERHYKEAIAQLEQGLAVAGSSELPQIRFYLAYADSLSGKTMSALKELHGITPNPGAGWAADFRLLKAKLLVDTYAFAEDVAWLTGPATALSEDSRRAPTYYLLLGVSYRGLGEVDLAKKSLATAVRLGGNSTVAHAAARLSAGL